VSRRRAVASADDAMTEASLQAAVLKLARLFGWRFNHPWISIRSEAGFPDLFLLRPPRALLAELKRETGKLTDAQSAWIADLERCPALEVHVWRPRDLTSGVILETLQW